MIVAIVLIIGGGVYAYIYYATPLGIAKDPVEEMHAMLDDNISLILSPLSASGNTDALPGVAELKAQIVVLHNATPPLNESVYRQAMQVCELLTIAATERNSYIKRLDQNRSVTKPLMIVSDKQSVSHVTVHTNTTTTSSLDYYGGSSQPTPAEHVKVDSTAVQKADVEMRVKHYEHAVIQQWNEKAGPYRNMISTRYPDFSLVVKQ